jgi:hypothetical protein
MIKVENKQEIPYKTDESTLSSSYPSDPLKSRHNNDFKISWASCLGSEITGIIPCAS